MRWLLLLLALAGCGRNAAYEPGSASAHVNGAYTSVGGLLNAR